MVKANPLSNSDIQLTIQTIANKVIECDEVFITDTDITLNFIATLTDDLTIIVQGVDNA